MASMLSGRLCRMLSEMNIVIHIVIGAALLASGRAGGVFQKFCNPGEYLHISPDGKEETCMPCIKGQTFMDNHSHRNPACFPCDLVRLTRGEQVKRLCDVTHNLERECKQGHFRNEYGECTLCKKCDGNTAVTQECTQDTDTVCSERNSRLPGSGISSINFTNPASNANPVNGSGSLREGNVSIGIRCDKTTGSDNTTVIIVLVGVILFLITALTAVFVRHIIIKIRNRREGRDDFIVLNPFPLLVPAPNRTNTSIAIEHSEKQNKLQDSITSFIPWREVETCV